MSNIIIQIIGFVAMVISILSYQSNSHTGIMIFKTISEALFALQYGLLFAYSGMAMNLIGLTRNIIFAILVAKNKKPYFFVGLYTVITIVVGAFTWSNFMTLLVIFAKVCTTFSFALKNAKLVRIFTIPACICWLIYNAYVFTIAGICTEAFGLISILIGYFRYDFKKIKNNALEKSPQSNITNINEKNNSYNNEIQCSDEESKQEIKL